MPGNNLAIRLTDQQENFTRAILQGRKPDDAARAAGYIGDHSSIGWKLVHMPAIAAAIRLGITRLLTVEALPLAYNVLKTIALDETAPAAVRRAAARDLIDRAGIVPPKAADSAGNGADKPLSDMSTGELRALVDRLESELGARAVDVSAQNTKRIDAKPLAFLD